MIEIVARRLQRFVDVGSMGVVTDTRYCLCYWPKLDRPTVLFAEGSRGIEVMGHPTPRNVIFPPDTVFLDYYPDALYPAELAVLSFIAKSKGPRAATFVNLTAREGAIWREAYDAAVASFPPTHSVHSTRPDRHFLRHREERLRRPIVLPDGRPGVKIDYDEYVAELTSDEVADLVAGRVTETSLRATKPFLSIDGGRLLGLVPNRGRN